MDLEMVVLRILHIVFGVFWVGSAFFPGLDPGAAPSGA